MASRSDTDFPREYVYFVEALWFLYKMIRLKQTDRFPIRLL